MYYQTDSTEKNARVLRDLSSQQSVTKLKLEPVIPDLFVQFMISFKIGIKSRVTSYSQCFHLLLLINIFENINLGCSVVLLLCLLTLKLLRAFTEEEKCFYHSQEASSDRCLSLYQ